MKFILGKKLGMTQVFNNIGDVVPVTKISAGPCYITQVRDGIKDNAVAVQLGFEEKKSFRTNKPQLGHLKDMPVLHFLRDFGIEKVEGVEKGDVVKADTFSEGDIVQVVGTSKGKGFAGVVKRHHFAGGFASQGHKDNERAPGSIGAGGVQRVFKGMRMGGHMGTDRVTVKNLTIIKVDLEKNELYIKGAVPGGRNGLLMISGKGDLKVTKSTAKAEPVAAPVVEADTVVQSETAQA